MGVAEGVSASVGEATGDRVVVGVEAGPGTDPHAASTQTAAPAIPIRLNLITRFQWFAASWNETPPRGTGYAIDANLCADTPLPAVIAAELRRRARPRVDPKP
jgi:hypothetical protein